MLPPPDLAFINSTPCRAGGAGLHRRAMADPISHVSANLPATIVRRVASLFRRFTPLKQGVNEVMPAKYGADRSLREAAQADRVQSYFQDVDVERYVRILDSTLFRAVGEYLQDRGYSVVEFMKLADPQVNNYDLSGSTLIDSAVGTRSSVNNTKKG